MDNQSAGSSAAFLLAVSPPLWIRLLRAHCARKQSGIVSSVRLKIFENYAFS
jgi:hypothetical protein